MYFKTMPGKDNYRIYWTKYQSKLHAGNTKIGNQPNYAPVFTSVGKTKNLNVIN